MNSNGTEKEYTDDDRQTERRAVRSREQRARRLARRLGFDLYKLRGEFYRQFGEAWVLAADGQGLCWGPNGGVDLPEIEKYLQAEARDRRNR